uniref:DUF1461 domain-containing protein n=1 Tax=uncultured Thiotrichaceae bacterium TaxID=298394 RepID=A0A6S6TW22_9GAMM|nr:MAG: Unknown protein [uncultured Thiotrichaceae bacterium]
MHHIKHLLFPWLLLFWLFCLPLAFAIYSPVLYQVNCHWNDRCERLGEETIPQRATEITQLFLHQSEALPKPWTEKETTHLLEVRSMYDGAFLIFSVVTFVFLLDYFLVKGGRHAYVRYARNALFISLGLLIAALLIIPFFNSFWIKIFHPLLFDNELWRTTSKDVSWYLMPKAFFLRVIVFICVSTVVLNLLVWLGLRGRKL